jgi:hypothetical protein
MSSTRKFAYWTGAKMACVTLEGALEMLHQHTPRARAGRGARAVADRHERQEVD